jgi:hypothetical protein
VAVQAIKRGGVFVDSGAPVRRELGIRDSPIPDVTAASKSWRIAPKFDETGSASHRIAVQAVEPGRAKRPSGL